MFHSFSFSLALVASLSIRLPLSFSLFSYVFFLPEAAQTPCFSCGHYFSLLGMLRKQLIIQPLSVFERGPKINRECARSVVSKCVHRESRIMFGLVIMWEPYTSSPYRVCATIIELMWNVPISIYWHCLSSECRVVRVRRKEWSSPRSLPLPSSNRLVSGYSQCSVKGSVDPNYEKTYFLIFL